MNNQYASLFTWRNRLEDYCIAHHDGAVSVMIEWEGFDNELSASSESWDNAAAIFEYLHNMDRRFFYENHWWREKDDTYVDEYIDIANRHTRGGDFGQFLRRECGEHIREWTRINSVATVITYPAAGNWLWGVLGKGSVKHQLLQQAKRSRVLLESVKESLVHLPGARLVTNQQYEQRIVQSSNRDLFLTGVYNHDPYIFLNEQLIRKPDTVDNLLYHNGVYHQLMFLPQYPDANPDWFFEYSGYTTNMHISQLIKPLNTQSMMNRSATSEKFSGANVSAIGQEQAQGKAAHESGYRQFVEEHDLESFGNCYIIHLYDRNVDLLKHFTQEIKNRIQKTGGKVELNPSFQLNYFRYAQPGQGYDCQFMRSDQTYQVGAMWPSQVFRTGIKGGEQLRLGMHGQPIGFSYVRDEPNSTLSSGQSGAGKDVEKGQSLFEVYTTGTDVYSMECGNSYKQMIEGLAGNDCYFELDPDESIISPFPTYAESDPGSEKPLPARIVEGTIRALGFLLLDDPKAGNVDFHFPEEYKSAAEKALQMLYVDMEHDQAAPTFENYQAMLAEPFYLEEDPDQQDAAIAMSKKLKAFTTGSLQHFNQTSNIDIKPGLVGFNLKPLMETPKLFKFFLVFLSLRIAQIAHAADNPCRILLNEFHAFVEYAPDVMVGLLDGMSRMGRKENIALDLVTQEKEEMDCVSRAVINSLQHHTFLYRNNDWDEISQRFSMPAPVVDIWRGYPNPKKLSYRNAFRTAYIDDYYNLLLTYPDNYMAVVTTKPSHLKIKQWAEQKTDNPFERIALFQKRLAKLEQESEVTEAIEYEEIEDVTLLEAEVIEHEELENA